MLYLDSENKKDITLYINCSGGDVCRLHTCSLIKPRADIHWALLVSRNILSSTQGHCSGPGDLESGINGAGGALLGHLRHDEVHQQRCGHCGLWRLHGHERLPACCWQEGKCFPSYCLASDWFVLSLQSVDVLIKCLHMLQRPLTIRLLCHQKLSRPFLSQDELVEVQARNCWEHCMLWITEAEYWLIWLMQGKRYALPNTRIMLHHPSGSARGQASDINNEAGELMRLRNYVNQVLCQATGQPIEKVCTCPCIPLTLSCTLLSVGLSLGVCWSIHTTCHDRALLFDRSEL